VLRFIVPLTDGPSYLGDVELSVAPDDSLAVAAPRLLQILEPLLKPEIFQRLKVAAGSDASITEIMLAREQIRLAYDSQTLALAIMLPVDARQRHTISLREQGFAQSVTLRPARVSAYLNLRTAVDVAYNSMSTTVTSPVATLDGAIRAGGVVAEGEGVASGRRNDPAFRRIGSRLVYDDLNRTMRWTLGDLRFATRSFQGSPSVAGLSVSRLYAALDPQREIRSTGTQSFTLLTPGMVETVVNGRTVERRSFQPGTYTLQDFPLAEGSNNVRLVIQDEAGKQRTVEFNQYSSRSLLEPGITEFSALAGFYSYPTISGIHYTNDWASAGFWRRGFSNRLTAGLNFQADQQSQQAGAEMLLGSDFGLMGVDFAGSRRRDGTTGYATTVVFEKLIQAMDALRSHTIRASVEYRSRNFAVPGAFFRERMSWRATSSYSYNFGIDDFVAMDVQYARDRIARVNEVSTSGRAGVSLGNQFSLLGEASYRHSALQRETLLRIGLLRRFARRATMRADADSHGEARMSFQDSGGQGIGAWTVAADIDRNDDGTTLNATGSYLTNRLELGVNQIAAYDGARDRISDGRTSFRAGTSIAFADGAVAIGRPINDGFLLAAPHHSLGGKAVRLDPQNDGEQAHSGTFGAGLQPDLSAYSKRTIVYDVPDAPPGYDLGQGNVQILPPYRGGYRLEIGSDYHILVLGRLIDANGEPISLLAGRAIELARRERQPVTIFTSRDGRFGQQGLRPGRWRIEMPTSPATVYEIEVVDDPTGTLRLGDLHPISKGEK
jgi:outer membrane usher protein